HVGVRKKIPVHTDGTGLLSSYATETLRLVHFAGCPKRHGMRELGSTVQPHGHSTFKIGRDQQRQLGIFLQTIEQLRSFIRLTAIQEWRLEADRHGERADVVLLHRVAKLQIVGTVHVQELGSNPDHEKLAYLFFERELANRLLRPLFAVAIEVNGTRFQVFVFGEGRNRKDKDQNRNAEPQHGTDDSRTGVMCQVRREKGHSCPRKRSG